MPLEEPRIALERAGGGYMKTYQDFLEVALRSESEKMDFVRLAIQDHKQSQAYKDAIAGEAYYDGRNLTIQRVQKVVYDALGQAFPDYTSANHKLADRFFYRAVNQARATLLGNGVTWKDGKGAEALGKGFDRQILKACRISQVQGVSFGFFNLDKVDIFELLEFCPLFDEEDGALKAGIRFWQLADNKPMRATLYEMDGYTEYIWEKGQGRIYKPKRGYVAVVNSSIAEGDIIYDYENYPSFPIVPCYANEKKVSELNPLRQTIDAMDLVSSGYTNDIDEANLIYWTVTNAGGMDDADLIKLMNKLKNLHMSQIDYDGQIQSHIVEPTFQGREALLDRLEKKLYKDAMALNVYDLASGAITATQIEASYEPLNEKLDIIEAQMTEFIDGLLSIAGVEDEPTYTRSMVVNKSEEIQALVMGAMYLPAEYVTEKIMTILGDKDAIDDVMAGIAGETLGRLAGGNSTPEGGAGTEGAE